MLGSAPAAGRLNWRELLSRLRASYWFVPFLVTLGGLVLAVVLLRADAGTPRALRGGLAHVVPGSPEGARALLSAIIASMVTAVSVTFSVTIVALTVAAQHFGPRVLNNFVRDTAAQVVLGTFIATFAYAVLVLGAVEDSAAATPVPALAVTGAVLLVVTSIGALIYYVHHVSTSLQVGELATVIADDLRQAFTPFYAEEKGTDNVEAERIPERPDDVAAIRAVESGYMQRIDFTRIVLAAAARDARVWVRREPGAFVVAGAPLALVAPAGACDDELTADVRLACVVGRDRTLWHDPEFAVKQLVEIALRALSPGVNEPFTAATCIDRLADGLAASLQAPRPRAVWRDDRGMPRVFAETQSFTTLLRAAFDPIRIFAGPNPGIYTRLAGAVGELALLARRPEDVETLREQIELIRQSAAARVEEEYGRRFVDARIAAALRQFEAGASGTRTGTDPGSG